MDKLNISREKELADLDFTEFNQLKYSVYVLDFNWNYIFVNDFVKQNLGTKGESLQGKNMWKTFTELAEDFSFLQLKQDAEKGKEVNFITTSPLTSQRLHVKGYSLKDCYFFYSSILPNKDELMNELRSSMMKTKLQ